ncbi:MAG TPA: hypothetical protein VGF98_13745 [Candidatus Tumulicola sp.]
MGAFRRWFRAVMAFALAASAQACSGGSVAVPVAGSAVPVGAQAPAAVHSANALGHAIVGFLVDTPQRAVLAASQGIDATILYGNSPPPNSALAKALQAHGISEIDGEISSELQYWECHRTHTVAPPPGGRNDYCHNDYKPQIDSERVVLHDVSIELDKDATRPYVRGFWVLDDWPYWDYGSAHGLLQKIHTLIAAKAPHEPAICGFGAELARPGRLNWEPGLAKNYSNDGCDMVGWYIYAPFGRRKPSNGQDLDWSMQSLLPAMRDSLAKHGWSLDRAPLLGIGPAWSGRYGERYYQPGLSRKQMQTQASAFCTFGATSISWWAWDDGAYKPKTKTPETSKTIAAGIADGIQACKNVWTSV